MAYAASQAVWIGAGGRVENNLFHDIGYDGMWGCPVSLWGDDNINNVVVTKNTMYRLGRGAIDNGYAWIQATASVKQTRKTLNNEYSYNDISQFAMLNQDGGAFYSWGWQDLAGNRFHHNWVHDLAAVRPPDGSLTDGIMAGFYFDQGSGPDVGSTPNTVDHNVFWHMGDAQGFAATEVSDIYTLPSYEVISKGPTRFYNNTFYGNTKSYVTYQNNVADVMRNNISRKDLNFNWGAAPSNVANALLLNILPLFTGGDINTKKGHYFIPTAISPAVNAGTAIPGITDGSVGTPDIGAYEYQGAAWVAGYTPVPQTTAPNTNPVVNITGPANNASFKQGAPITITATASDANGTITRVEFFNGTTKIGEDLTTPYSFVWSNAAPGTYIILAKATDNQGGTTTSTAVTITITANAAPTIQITSPANNAQFTVGTAVAIAATAADANGTVAKVEFFDGAAKLGEDLSSPYTFTWNNPVAGAHVLTAKATDNDNSVTTSTAVNINVTNPATGNSNPVVAITAPANSASFASGSAVNITATASDVNGSVTKVEFFAGTTKLGEDLTSPYNYSWTNAAVGTYTLTAKATDNQNNTTTSSGVNITVLAPDAPIPPVNLLPIVVITQPVAGERFIEGFTIALAASANDPDGTITKVEFLAGTTKIGEDLTAPYTFDWVGAQLGEHTLTAVATDNKLETNGSAATDILVVAADDPSVEGDDYSGIPRFFSPNNDGTGDLWVWGDNPSYVNASLTVFNRAGMEVYAAAPYKNNWDGKSGGQALEDGDYYYVVRLANNTELRGAVRIIR